MVTVGMIKVCPEHRLREYLLYFRLQSESLPRTGWQILWRFWIYKSLTQTQEIFQGRRIISFAPDDCGEGWEVQGPAFHELMACGGDDICRHGDSTMGLD